MPQEQITIATKDGECPAFVARPDGDGPWPGVVFYMDAFGVRPAMKEMATRLASEGYVVLLPDLYYRIGAYGPLSPKELLKGDFRAVIGPLQISTDNHRAAEDTQAFLDYLHSRKDVAGEKFGVVGFCMGGGMALTAAGYYPDRIAAAASFHGGRLATDDPKSPHLLVPRIKAHVYVAAADNDQSYPPDMAVRFEAALSDAGLTHVCETYHGKAHGWMKPDMPVFDADAADRGWRELVALFARTLV